MRLFILLAILFFSWRIFAQTFDYYYIDEYMRAKEDPDYAKYVIEKRQAVLGQYERAQAHKLKQEYQAYLQEQSREQYVAQRKKVVDSGEQEKLERQYNIEKEKEEAAQLKADLEYNAAMLKAQIKKEERPPDRMFASVASGEHHRVPKDKRKFRLHVTKVIHQIDNDKSVTH